MQLNVTVLIPVEDINNMALDPNYADDSLTTLIARYIQEELYDAGGMGGEFRVTHIGEDNINFRVGLTMRFPYSYWAAAQTANNLLDPLLVHRNEGRDLMAPTTFKE